jgi:hypothetical protein
MFHLFIVFLYFYCSCGSSLLKLLIVLFLFLLFNGTVNLDPGRYFILFFIPLFLAKLLLILP